MLQDTTLNIKQKLSSLWASVMALYLYGDYFELYVPGKAKSLVEGTGLLDSPTRLFLAAALLAIPSLMIAMSVLLPAHINRVLNLLFSVLLTVVVILVGSASISAWNSFYVMYTALEILITATIFWTAWKWPPKNQ
jgi:hypothetical protein